jgi:hypothetical protein
MLHLLPLRWLLKAAVVLTALGLVAAAALGTLGPGGFTSALGAALRIALLVEAALWILLTFGWSYTPGFKERVFPEIGGSWHGHIHYVREGASQSKPATLHIHQNLTSLRLLLETDESESQTLVARPERDPDFSRFKLFYIYENTRKEGMPGAGRIYRGTAFLVLPPGRPKQLSGSYFTEQGGVGTLEFARNDATHSIPRKLWLGVVGPRGLAMPGRLGMPPSPAP